MWSEEEKARIMEETNKKAEEFIKKRMQVPESEKILFDKPEKWNFPIGLDDYGNPFPVDVEREEREAKALAKSKRPPGFFKKLFRKWRTKN